MNSKILEQVKSPFQDKLIHELIKKYISCGCDDNLFYSEINGLESNKMNIDSFTNTLINKIYSQGVEKSEVWSMTDEEKNHLPFIYNKNSSWIIVYSEEEPMQDNQRNSNNQRPLVYRIYLNLKGKEKADFVENYMKVCQDKEIPFEFKFSIDNSRCDQIVLLSRLENFEENISIVEELTRNIQLGNLPMLIGEYKNNIGIAEEYYNRLYSPTTAKLALVRSSVKKYLCDHKDEFYEQLSEEEKEKIEVIFTGLDKQYIKFVDELKEQACNNNVDIKIIRFDYMAEVYKIGDLTILPSKSESFGYSALESLSMGIYTILNDIPTFNEIALNNGFNYIFKNNIIELKEKISEIINNKKYQKRVMPKHSWQEQYTLENFEKSYINLFV